MNNIDISDISGHLTPQTTVDNTPPEVAVLSPNGGETLVGNQPFEVTWTATDASGIVAIHLYQSIDGGTIWTPVIYGLENTGSYQWTPANRPTGSAMIRVVAVDGAVNTNSDENDSAFTIESPVGGRVPTTLRDFDMPGSQPFEAGSEPAPPSDCAQCHGGFNPDTEPYANWQGSMMALASIDPLFEANLVIANQDAPDSGDLCLRCHISGGWMQGRSIPTDGSAMLERDKVGVSCDLCHRMVDPNYIEGLSPARDQQVLADLSFPGTHYGNDMTGGSTWTPQIIADLYPTKVNQAAVTAGIGRARYMLRNAADLEVEVEHGRLKAKVTNQTGHKLPTGYPEGRRIWLNVKFFDAGNELIHESGAYNTDTGELAHDKLVDPEVKIYEVQPGISDDVATVAGVPAGKSFHFVLNNMVVSDNRIPPRGFTNAGFASFGGAPVGHSYADGQYWDETEYTIPAATARAEVRLFYQSTSKEFVEFMLSQNNTHPKVVQMYQLWNDNGKCPPELMEEASWVIDPLADDDGDGITNGIEQQYAMNPFDPADALLDTDGDGLDNLTEIALGSNPTDAASTHWPHGEWVDVTEPAGRHFALSYIRRIGYTAADIVVEVSDDLVTWHSGTAFTVTQEVSPRDEVTENVVERMVAPMDASSPAFMRLRITPK